MQRHRSGLQHAYQRENAVHGLITHCLILLTLLFFLLPVLSLRFLLILLVIICCSSSFSLLVLHLHLLFSGALRCDFTSVGLAPTPCGLHCPRSLPGCVLTHARSGRHAERLGVGALHLHVLRTCARGWIARMRGPCGPVDAKSC